MVEKKRGRLSNKAFEELAKSKSMTSKELRKYRVYKQLVKDECCEYYENYNNRPQACLRTDGGPCKIMQMEKCENFNQWVKPLLWLKDKYKKGLKYKEFQS